MTWVLRYSHFRQIFRMIASKIVYELTLQLFIQNMYIFSYCENNYYFRNRFIFDSSKIEFDDFSLYRLLISNFRIIHTLLFESF